MKAQKSTARAFPGRKDENRYKGTIEIVAESTILYSMSLLVLIIFIVIKNPNIYYPQNIHAQISELAPLLIILRVAAGYSRPESEWNSSHNKLWEAGGPPAQ